MYVFWCILRETKSNKNKNKTKNECESNLDSLRWCVLHVFIISLKVCGTGACICKQAHIISKYQLKDLDQGISYGCFVAFYYINWFIRFTWRKTLHFQGLCFVEMDVILSKDMIPVIYHDYHIEISCRQVINNCKTKLLLLLFDLRYFCLIVLHVCPLNVITHIWTVPK